MTSRPPTDLLIYEPRTEGHHLGWLRFIVEDLHSAGLRLALAVDLRPERAERVRAELGEFANQVSMFNACAASGQQQGGGRAGSVAHSLRASGAQNVFLCAFDEIASHCLRRAAFGLWPPGILRGHMGGIYHRPRFFTAPWWSPNRWLKQRGFRRLLQDNWLRPLLFVDEYLAADLQQKFPRAPLSFLPDPCPTGYDGAACAARRQLELPEDKKIFLFYGGGYRRKGLHLAVSALSGLPSEVPAFLLCAGQLDPAGATARGLNELSRQNRARLVNRYVSVAEEKLFFAASDAVLLPYLNHFGTSGVLSRAMSARKPVIVSDEHLLGRLTREHGLGLVFPTGRVDALRECLRQAVGFLPETATRFAAAACGYAERYSRKEYRRALIKSLGICPEDRSPP